ncbi:MAG: hypothetical protein KDA78_12520 [Planctomycetaceae bacterium]|nr:hypothetical protein [Planctomycetaceae bacterium]
MSQVVSAFAGGDHCGELADRVPEGLDRALLGNAELVLKFGKHRLDWIQIVTLRWQVSHTGFCSQDGLGDSGQRVRNEVIHDDDVAWVQISHQVLFDPRQEEFSVDGPIDDYRSDQTMTAKSTQKSCRFPMTVRHGFDESLAPLWTSLAEASCSAWHTFHRGRHAAAKTSVSDSYTSISAF